MQRYWRHPTFRDGQEQIITSILQGKDVLALLPTGAGKSLCFQIPALARPGICIVISPLIALMEDQVKELQAKGIKAISLAGARPGELDTLLDNAIFGGYKFLYLSPERLQQDLVKDRLKKMEVNLIAIDEAHCISQWGHDFRPSYRNIKLLRDLKPRIPIIALSATATPPVVADIQDQLDMQEAKIVRTSLERKNLEYQVVKTDKKRELLAQMLSSEPGSAIVYVRSRKGSEKIAELLVQRNIKAASYHAGLSKEDKSQRAKTWSKNEIQVMVATSAFGMGIDKPDVRQVIHLDLPESLESYFQEAGRAGRNGKPAKAVLLVEPGDIERQSRRLLEAVPSPDNAKLLYRKLNAFLGIAYGEGEHQTSSFNFYDFCTRYGFPLMLAYNTLALLDSLGILTFSQHFQKRTRIRILVPPRHLYDYLESHPQFDPVIQALVRSYGGLFDHDIAVDPNKVAKRAGTPTSEVIKVLRKIQRESLINFEHDAFDTRITFLVPREDEVSINPFISEIKVRATGKKEKFDKVLEYIRSDCKCRSMYMQEYFGSPAAVPCLTCTVCTSGETRQPLSREIIDLLQHGEYSLTDLSHQLPVEKKNLAKELHQLEQRGAIIRTTDQKFKLRHL